MNVSRPAVHPVEAPALTEAADHNPRVRMKDLQGMPGTRGGLILRVCQFIFSLISLSVMASTSDFHQATAFCYLVLAVGLQTLWSLSVVIVDTYALLVGRSLLNIQAIRLFTIGDGITSTLTFAAACASAGITVLIGNDLNKCAVNHCTRLKKNDLKSKTETFMQGHSFGFFHRDRTMTGPKGSSEHLTFMISDHSSKAALGFGRIEGRIGVDLEDSFRWWRPLNRVHSGVNTRIEIVRLKKQGE